ncbi:ATP-binding cassette domain-containing protein [Metabacillus sp. RGM 3146]|uniref:ATP-binding cassette domain-containing protein n=1 Tax=Metabacillus sp. RGM 3146 TaxID=3401092 RepID=UPI003B9C9374
MTVNGRLQLQSIKKSFGSHDVLKNFSLDLEPGEFAAIVGKSGCGKSTLLRIAAGLERQDEGEIRVNNTVLKGLNKNSRMMFQDGRLFPWKTVLQNVGTGLKGDWKEKALSTLEKVGLRDRANDWPTVLSGGQRQRVALARALINEPSILLLDEPLGALDALTRIEMQRLIEKIWQENRFTALLVTHDTEEAIALADRVIVIDEGKAALNMPVSLPRPRQRDSAAFAQEAGKLLDQILGKEERIPERRTANA